MGGARRLQRLCAPRIRWLGWRGRRFHPLEHRGRTSVALLVPPTWALSAARHMAGTLDSRFLVDPRGPRGCGYRRAVVGTVALRRRVGIPRLARRSCRFAHRSLRVPNSSQWSPPNKRLKLAARVEY